LVPAVLYGPGLENAELKIKKNDFEKLLKQAGGSTLVDLTIDGKNTEKVLIKTVQREGLYDQVLHVDFFKPSEKKRIIVRVPLVFTGIAKTVKDMGGMQLINMEMIKMRVFAKDLISKIEIDLSKIEKFSDVIRVKDIEVSDAIEVLDNPNNAIASTASPKVLQAQADAAEAAEAPKEAEATEEKKDGEEDKKDEKKEEAAK
jgi:large subunit ribosomal protein L25